MKLSALVFLLLFFGTMVGSNAQYLDQITKQMHQPSDLKKDIDLVQNTLEREHPNLYLYISKKALENKFDSLRNSIDKPLTSVALYVNLLHIISSIGDGHLNLEIDYSKITPQDVAFLKIPALQHPIYQFSYFVTGKQLFIMKNLSADSTIAKGTEIISINNLPAGRLIDSLNGYITGDGYSTTYRKHLMNNGVFAERYRFLFPEKDPLTMVIKSSGSSKEIKIAPRREKGYDSIGGVKPPTAEYKILTADSNVAYFKVRSFYNGNDYVGYQGIFHDIERRKLKTLIIDLRGNMGGELIWAARIYSHLLDSPRYFFRLPEEIKMQKKLYDDQKIRNWVDKLRKSDYEKIHPYTFTFKGKIYVLIDGGSFSSSSILSANLKNLKNVTLVGEETGGSKNVVTAGVQNSLTLPVTQLLLRYGNGPAFYGDLTTIDGRGVMPDVPITYRIEDYLAGKDLEMDWVLKDVAKNGARP
ncbi:peptidase S41 [Pedobacter sp. BAL39]|uniref:S41 family peptidase n=1 Tax=Pedobacter sp. BAL39 TaxID=391596 RepID=UPI000155A0D7|nr:S41 family peptidase [Pedobacter sp. BAL39]EDM37916.1 peptidase S41 [Pedobacter sp. BAL39]